MSSQSDSPSKRPMLHSEALRRILSAEHPPRVSDGPRQIPWHDPEFSRRMLDVHLDPTTHMASRAPEVIGAHIDWLQEQLEVSADLNRPADQYRILDVGCGPGLYCHEQARRGIPSTGFDFAPAPLAWAEKTAKAEQLDCKFLNADLTNLPDDFAQTIGPQDAITFWFGEFHSFPADQVTQFLARLAECLVPGGLFVLEYQPWDEFVQEDSSDWSSQEKSVFCDEPHLWLQEFGWDEKAKTEIHVHWIIPEQSGILQQYVQCHQAWTDEQLVAMLAAAGLESCVFHPPITGVSEEFEFPVVVSRRPA
jgi:SAM-dependent methyltransferase